MSLVLVDVMAEWRQMLDDDRASSSRQPQQSPALGFDLPRVEGYALSVLCSNSVQVHFCAAGQQTVSSVAAKRPTRR